MSRHAYLILAHHQAPLLGKLLRLLDDDRNDVFVHVDAKAKGFVEADLRTIVTNSRLHFTKRTRVMWGSYSMINAELLLLRSAVPNNYAYYHLLSGSDLPLRTQKSIHDFFEEHQG